MWNDNRAHARGWMRAGTAAVVLALLVGTPVPVMAGGMEDSQDAEQVAAVPRLKLQPGAQQKADAEPAPGVNINTATVAELMFLPRVGQKKAEAIVARRDRRKFLRPEEIMEVKGFGRATYRRLKPFVRTTGPTTATAKLKEVG